MLPDKVYVTKEGKEALLKKRDELYANLGKIQAQKAEAAVVGGDGWHDNFAFEDLTRQETAANKSIADLAQVIERIDTVGRPTDNNTVQVGHIVVLENTETGEEVTYQVGGFDSSDLGKSPAIIAYNAPILTGFFGHEVDHTHELRRGNETTIFELTKITGGAE